MSWEKRHQLQIEQLVGGNSSILILADLRRYKATLMLHFYIKKKSYNIPGNKHLWRMHLLILDEFNFRWEIILLSKFLFSSAFIWLTNAVMSVFNNSIRRVEMRIYFSTVHFMLTHLVAVVRGEASPQRVEVLKTSGHLRQLEESLPSYQ